MFRENEKNKEKYLKIPPHYDGFYYFLHIDICTRFGNQIVRYKRVKKKQRLNKQTNKKKKISVFRVYFLSYYNRGTSSDYVLCRIIARAYTRYVYYYFVIFIMRSPTHRLEAHRPFCARAPARIVRRYRNAAR